MKQQKGFTLIELIVVIVILGILGATALPKFVNLAGDARASVMQGVNGSMAAANAMIYAKAAAGGTLGATGTVTINGATVNVVYGFAATVADLRLVMDLNPSGDFVTSGNNLRHGKAATPASCQIVYTPATATTSPGYDASAITSANCA